MIRTRLHYHRPDRLEAASTLLAEYHGNVVVLAGGTKLLPEMNRNEIQVDHIVDLRGLQLNQITNHGAQIEIGAMVTYDDVFESALMHRKAGLLTRMCRGITGGRQLTQQATLVGSACQNFPSSDIPGVLVALDAQIRLYGAAGFRDVPAVEFFLEASVCDIRRSELVVGILVSTVQHYGYCKVKHCGGSWPIATASAVRDPALDTISVTLGAVQALPVRVVLTDPSRVNEEINHAITAPWTDVLAPGSYRAAIAAAVARRAIAEMQEGIAQ